MRVLSVPNSMVELSIYSPSDRELQLQEQEGKGRPSKDNSDSIGVDVKQASAAHSKDRLAYNRAVGLHASIQEDNLLPAFSFELVLDDVFRPSWPSSSPSHRDQDPASIDALIDQHNLQSMLDLIS